MDETREEIQSRLDAFFDFQECVLLDVRQLAPGLDAVLTVAYIWSDEFGVVAEPTRKIELRFYDVERLSIHSELFDAVLEERNRVGWGFAEFSDIVLADTASLDPIGRPRHTAVVRWENDRRIEIEFSRLRVRDIGAVTSEDERLST